MGSCTVGGKSGGTAVPIPAREPDDEAERTFEPSVQIARDPGNPAEGTGAGLAIGCDLARVWGGEFRAESGLLGVGSASIQMRPR